MPEPLQPDPPAGQGQPDGSQTGTTPPAPPAQPAPTPATPPPAAAGPSQADIDAAVAKALGVPLAEAKKALADAEKARKAQMSEAERLQAEAAEAVAKAQKEAADAATTAYQARVQIALVRAGVHPDKLEWAARLVAAPTDADDKTLAAAIDAAKAAVPEVFAGTTSGAVPPPPAGGNPPPPSSNPPGSPPPPKATPDVKQKAAALIKERFPNLASGGDGK